MYFYIFNKPLFETLLLFIKYTTRLILDKNEIETNQINIFEPINGLNVIWSFKSLYTAERTFDQK